MEGTGNQMIAFSCLLFCFVARSPNKRTKQATYHKTTITMAEAERGSFAIPGSKSDEAAADGDYVPKNIFLTGGAGEFRLFCGTSCAKFHGF